MNQLALDAADAAVERVEKNANQEWMIAAGSAVRAVAVSMTTFTTDDVWDMLTFFWTLNIPPVTTHEPRAMGAVMRRAVKDGVCVATPAYERSSRVECHARPVRIWRSLVKS